MKRVLVMVFALMLVAAACGDDDATSTTVTQASASDPAGDGDTSAAVSTDDTDTPKDDPTNIGEGENTEFCRFIKALDEDDDSFQDLDPASIRADIEESQDLIRQAVSRAPSEIKAEIQLLADAFNTFAKFLADNDYDILTMATSDDPALLAFDTPAVDEAGERVNDFCGIEDDFDDGSAFGDDILPVDPPGAGTLPPDFLSSNLPEDFPAELVPPSVTETSTVSIPVGFGVIFTTSASFEETVAYYTDVVGEDPLVIEEGGRNATWIQLEGGAITTVSVAEGGGVLQVSVSSSG